MFLHALVISGRIIKSHRIAISWMAILSLAMVCVNAVTNSSARAAHAQQETQDIHVRPPNLPMQAYLTKLYVSVYDRDGKLVDELPREAFHLYEDKAVQRISAFGHTDEAFRIGLLVDTSGTMFKMMGPVKEALKRFVQASNPQDKFFGATFADSVIPVTSIQALIDSVDARGSTKARDALYFGLVELEDTRNFKKALVIISDGGDNSSRHSRDDVLKLVREAGVPIYALGLLDALSPGSDREQQTVGSHFLDEACKLSGGRFIRVKQLTDLPDLAAEIGTELRKQYTLSYYPTSGIQGPHDVRWRKIEVKVETKGVRGPLKVVAPPGYVAQPQ
jgi:Ca-activated chloride channel family protein